MEVWQMVLTVSGAICCNMAMFKHNETAVQSNLFSLKNFFLISQLSQTQSIHECDKVLNNTVTWQL